MTAEINGEFITLARVVKTQGRVGEGAALRQGYDLGRNVRDAQSVLLGGHVRVGLEDNIYLKKGVFASNGQLVEKAIQIIELLGARALTPAEARTKLRLKTARPAAVS